MRKPLAALATCLVTLTLIGATCSNDKCTHTIGNVQVSACTKHTYNLSADCTESLRGTGLTTDTGVNAGHQCFWYDHNNGDALVAGGAVWILPPGGGGITCNTTCTNPSYSGNFEHSTTSCPASSGMAIWAGHNLMWGPIIGPEHWTFSEAQVTTTYVNCP